MESQIRGLTMGIRHAQDGQSLLGTVEGAMQEVNKILQRMRELAVQASSGIASSVDKNYLNLEMTNLIHEIKAIGLNSKFTLAKLNLQTAVVSIGGGENAAGIAQVVTAIDNALATIDSRRAGLGAISNRFDHIIDNLQNVIMNTTQSKSRIVDADFSIETTNLTRNTVLQQAATSMLAQANAQKNSILSLIQQ